MVSVDVDLRASRYNRHVSRSENWSCDLTCSRGMARQRVEGTKTEAEDRGRRGKTKWSELFSRQLAHVWCLTGPVRT